MLTFDNFGGTTVIQQWQAGVHLIWLTPTLELGAKKISCPTGWLTLVRLPGRIRKPSSREVSAKPSLNAQWLLNWAIWINDITEVNLFGSLLPQILQVSLFNVTADPSSYCTSSTPPNPQGIFLWGSVSIQRLQAGPAWFFCRHIYHKLSKWDSPNSRPVFLHWNTDVLCWKQRHIDV